MRSLIFLATFSLLLSSCTKTQTPEISQESPYPSIPLTASGEVTPDILPVSVNAAYSAKGTEPFWGVAVKGTTATLSRPGDDVVVTTDFSVTQDDKESIISIKGVKGDFFLTLTKGSCSDGMSDIQYAYNASLSVGAEELKGCANKE